MKIHILKREKIIMFLYLLLTITSMNACKNSQTAISLHQTYRYTHPASLLQVTFLPNQRLYILHSRTNLTLLWASVLGPTSTQNAPEHISLAAEIFGPFRSLDILNVYINYPEKLHQPAKASMPPIQTTSWADQTYTPHMKLPPNTQPGYYLLFETITLEDGPSPGIGKARIALQIPK